MNLLMHEPRDDRAFYAATCLSFVAGAMAGAAVACLLAPSSGRETRDRMSRRLGETAEAARVARNKVIRKGAEAIHAASRKGEEAAERLVSRLQPSAGSTS
jgi:gas vesicle protein